MKKETLAFLFDHAGFLHGFIWIPPVFILAFILGFSTSIPLFVSMCIYTATAMTFGLIPWGLVVDKALSSSKMRVDK